MQAKTKKGTAIRSILLALLFFAFISGPKAQITTFANIQAAIVKVDISTLSASSTDGTQFVLQNGMNSCFDLSIGGLQPILESGQGIQKVTYGLSFDQRQPASFGTINIRLNIMFNETVKDGSFTASTPYTISVNYN